MTSLSERMLSALADAQKNDSYKSQAGLARACGIKTPSVSGWFTGKTKNLTFENAVKAAAYLGVSAEWLATGEGDMHSASVIAVDEFDDLDDDDVVRIPEYKARCAAGDSQEVIYDEITSSIPAVYRRRWFQEKGINPAHCKRFKVHGDSMEPLLWDGDTILVDCGAKEVLDGKIYAFMIRGSMRVKILHPLLRGGYLVQSLNPDAPDETLDDGDLDAFVLIGRVRDRSGSNMF